MNFNNFTIKSQEALQKAIEIAKEKNQQSIEPAHILLGVFLVGENVVNFLFQKLGINSRQLNDILNREIDSFPRVSGGEPYLSRESNADLDKAVDISKKMSDQFVSLEHLLLAILSGKSSAGRSMKDAGVTEKELQAAIVELRKGNKVSIGRADIFKI